jgi:VanZ family protein
MLLAVRIATAIYWITIFALTHVPVTIPKRGPGDKTIHFVVYAILGVLLWLSIKPRRWMIPAMVGMLMVYGAIDELTQPLVGRSCEFNDWLADSAGAVVATGACALVTRLTKSKGV